MSYNVRLSDRAKKDLKRIDRYQTQIIIAWIEKNLSGCTDPRAQGKPLEGDKKGYWRYRVGVYRLIAKIVDSQVRIDTITVGHRRKVYDS